MGVESAALIKTLNKTCLNALQSAAGLCLSRTNPSVEVEHWLVKLIELPDSDLTRIFRQFEVDTSHLLRDLTKVIDGFRTGNQRTPTLSLKIDQVIRAAWVIASIQYQARQIRSGMLLLALLEDEELGRLARDCLARARQDQARPAPAELREAGRRLGRGRGPRRRRGGCARRPGPAGRGHDPDAVPRPVHHQPDRAGQEGRDRPGHRPRGRGPPDGRHPDPPPPEQPDPHRRGRRRQDGRRRGPGPADRRGRRPPCPQERRPSAPSTSACSRPAPA